MKLIVLVCLFFYTTLSGGADPCTYTDCAPGYICSSNTDTGAVWCEPSCDSNNGGCGSNEICTLNSDHCRENDKQCRKTIQCVSPCASTRCSNGYRCEVDKDTGSPYCNPSCTLNNGGCADDEVCTLVQVECFTTPCPPMVQCSH